MVRKVSAVGTEEDAVNRLFVLISEGGNLLGQGEDDVEILGFQKFGLTVFQPVGAGEGLALGTVSIGTGVIGRALVAAAVTLLQMTAQSGSAAEFDVAHHPPLRLRERWGMFLPVGRPVAAEDIRHF
jgi:hypothetical protein